MNNETNNGAAMAVVSTRKVREQKTERVKLSASQNNLIDQALLAYRETILGDLDGLDPVKHKRFIDRINSDATELATLAENLRNAEYVAYAAPIAGE